MNSQQNNIIQTEINNYPNYISAGNNYDINQNKIITNRAKELIKNFKKQHQIDIDNNNDENQKILPTDINRITFSQQKAREELKSYDYYIRGEGKENKQEVPQPQKNNLINEIPTQNIDLMNQENAKLKKQVMNLILENNNLKNKVNFNNNNKSFMSHKIYRNNNNYIPKNDFENNISMNANNRNDNIAMNDKMFLEKSMESIIKSNMRMGQKNNNNDFCKSINLTNNNNNKILYTQRNPNCNYNNIGFGNQNYIDNILNMNNNIYNNRNYSSNNNIMSDYNQLLNEYRNTKFKLDNIQFELQNNKSIENKYRILNNNYNDIKNRNKELIITIQKLKNDNAALSQHIEELSKQKRKAESKLKNKIKINIENNNINNINELKALKNRYTELQKNLEDMMKSKKEAANNEYRKRNERNVLLNENKKLKNEINNYKKKEIKRN